MQIILFITYISYIYMIMLYDISLLASEQLLSILIFHFIIFILILFDDRMDAQYEVLITLLKLIFWQLTKKTIFSGFRIFY